MKKTIGTLVVLCLLCFTGCAHHTREALPDEEKTLTEAVRTEQPSYFPILRSEGLKDLDADNPAGMLQKHCGNVMVKIVAGNLAGSGVLYDADEEFLWIVTAQHVLENAGESVQVTFADGFRAGTDLIMRSKTHDLAFLKIRREDLVEEKTGDSGKTEQVDHAQGCRLTAVSKEAYDAMARGDLVIAMGSKSGVGEDAYAGVLLQDYAFVDDFDAYLMVADVFVTPGMSGGGLFDAKGNLLGIICGVAEDGEVAVAPLLGIMTMDR